MQAKNLTIAEYKKKADATLEKILQIRARVQKKVDEEAYKKQLEKLRT